MQVDLRPHSCQLRSKPVLQRGSHLLIAVTVDRRLCSSLQLIWVLISCRYRHFSDRSASRSIGVPIIYQTGQFLASSTLSSTARLGQRSLYWRYRHSSKLFNPGFCDAIIIFPIWQTTCFIDNTANCPIWSITRPTDVIVVFPRWSLLAS